MQYRNRIYQSYFSDHFSYTHIISKDAYDFTAMVYKKRFSTFIPKDKTAKIIDIACGSGNFVYFLQKEGYINTSGIDLSEEQIAMANKIGVPNVAVHDLLSFLPKWPNEFDMIVASDIIEHFTKTEVIQFLDAIRGALKPQGVVLICTCNGFSLFGASTVFADFTHEVGFTPISLAQVLRACGFSEVEVYGEKPIAYDLRSKIRQILWGAVNRMLRVFLYIERGYGREVTSKRPTYIFESRIFAVARKP
jgi:2-polyprenyl-3-methyl-5-hydroxy-6-metoxy-1,4-benzoquinol methylase